MQGVNLDKMSWQIAENHFSSQLIGKKLTDVTLFRLVGAGIQTLHSNQQFNDSRLINLRWSLPWFRNKNAPRANVVEIEFFYLDNVSSRDISYCGTIVVISGF